MTSTWERSRSAGARSRVAVAGTALALGVGAAACGSGGGSGSGASGSSNNLESAPASQILHTAVKNMSDASSFRMHGTVSSGGTTLTLDLSLYKGGSASGTFKVHAGSADLVVAGGNTYLKGTSGFWTALGASGGASGSTGSSVGEMLAGKWISLPSTSGSAFSAFTVAGLTNKFTKQAGKVTKVGTRTISGQPSVGIKSTTQGVLWVATTGPGYPVELTQNQSSTSQFVAFSDWNNAGHPPTAPKGAKSIQQLVG